MCCSNAQVGFKSFLNITPTVTHAAAPPPTAAARANPSAAQLPSAAAGAYFHLTFDENPLAEFVELPDDALAGGLWYSNVLCGVLRGALEMVRVFRYRGAGGCAAYAGSLCLGADAGGGRVCVGRAARRRDH